MRDSDLFSILDTVDSTNNYAMRFIREQSGNHGMAFFANNQVEGKGQRGKKWISEPGENIIMSVIFKPNPFFSQNPFVFNAFVSNCCRTFLDNMLPEPVKIKWPNDLYVNDRKAAGILVENIYQGTNWHWSVVGIGVNINQTSFEQLANRATSVSILTWQQHDTIELAKQLHQYILQQYEDVRPEDAPQIMENYNRHLYKQGAKQKFREGAKVFVTEIQSVNQYGQLICQDTLPRVFEFGTLEWIME